MKGSIEAAVERAFGIANGDPKIPRDRRARLALLRRGLIPWLAGIDPDTGAPRRRVARLSEIPTEARPLVDLLVDQRLLSTDIAKDTKEKTVEPAHEALLRQWGLLQGWLAEDAGLLTVMDGVKRASRDWAANAKGAEWLLHASGRLSDAERLRERPDLAANLEPTDWAYLGACRDQEVAAQKRQAEVQMREAEQAKRIVRRTLAGLAVAVVLAMVASTFGFYALQQKREATNEATRAEKAATEATSARQDAVSTRDAALLTQSKFLADLSRQVTEQEKDPGTGLLLALEALRDTSSDDEITRGRPYWTQAEVSLESARRLLREQIVLKDHLGSVTSVAVTPDGARIVTGSDDKTARIWDAKTGAELAQPHTGHTALDRQRSGDAGRGPHRHRLGRRHGADLGRQDRRRARAPQGPYRRGHQRGGDAGRRPASSPARPTARRGSGTPRPAPSWRASRAIPAGSPAWR